MKRIITIIAVFCLVFTSLPFFAGEMDSYALAKNITLRASASGRNAANLSWNKIKSPNKGYAVFRDGVAVGHFNTKRTSFADSGLAAGSSHSYQIKTYKSKKKTQWFNKKTQKWQNKKPAKKIRGKSRKVTTYSYKKKSNTVWITTQAPPQQNTTINKTKYTITWKNWNGATLKTTTVNAGVVPSYGSGTPTRPDDSSYTYTFKGWSPAPVAATTNATYTATYYQNTKPSGTRTVVDYLGTQRTITKSVVNGQTYWSDGSSTIKDSALPKWDRDTDGQFNASNGHTMQNYHGATFDMTELNNITADLYDLDSYSVKMYNGDASKFIIEPDENITISGVSTYKEVGKGSYTPITKYYLYKNGHPIAETHDNESSNFVYNTTKSGSITTKQFGFFSSPRYVGEGLGIWTDDFNVNIKYDGKLIATKKFDTTAEARNPNWTKNTCNGMSPYRRIAIDIADTAMAEYASTHGGQTHGNSITEDLQYISSYIERTYAYDEAVSGYGAELNMNCTGGALVLETYSIMRWNKFGFRSGGSNYYVQGHNAFNLNEQPSRYYEAEGQKN